MKEAIQGVGLMVPCDVSGLPLLEEQVLCQRTPGIITEMSRLLSKTGDKIAKKGTDVGL